MDSGPFISYAQNCEDVVLYRALRDVTAGRYVEVGANEPIADSVTYAFYERGWSGVTVEPVPAFAEKLRQTRPRDTVIEAAITADALDSITLHTIADTGLSTLVDDVGRQHADAGWEVTDIEVPARRLDDVLADADLADQDIHLLLVDTEGAEQSVLESVDLRRWRPWVMVVESTRPNSTEPTHESWEHIVLAADYRFCLFDGLSRFYLAQEKWDDLHEALSAPANILDGFKPYRQVLVEREVARLGKVAEELTAERDRVIVEMQQHDDENTAAILDWRTTAVKAWSRASSMSRRREIEQLHHEMSLQINHIKVVDAEIDNLRGELDALRNTVSWRVTKPLRRARSVTRKSAS